MANKQVLECGMCGGKAHFIDGKFKGCCASGHCENEGYKSIEEWNKHTLRCWELEVDYKRTMAENYQKMATALEEKIMKARANGRL